MEQVSLKTMAQQLREKKAQIEANVAKLQMEAKFNLSGFYNDLLQRVDILVASGGSISNPDSYFQQEITNVMNLYQIPLENEMNQAFNLQGIFAVVNILNTPPPASSSIVIENSLQVIGQKLLQKKTQVEASLLRLQMEIRINLIGYYEYLLQRVDILAVARGSIPNTVVYLQEEIGKASTRYQKPLAITLTEAFNLQAVFSGENREHGQSQASSQAGASFAAAAPNQAENEANSGIVALLEEDEDDIKSEFNSDVEDQMPEAAEESRNEHRGYSQAAAEQWYNLYRQSMPQAPGPVNPNRRPSAPVKEEIMDDNPLALVLYQPPASHRVDSGSIEELEENYLGDDDESENEDAIVEEEEEEFAEEESDHLEERDVLMSDEEDGEASFADDDGDDSNEDAIMDEIDDDDEDAEENMNDIEEDQQNDNQEDNSIDDDERDDSSDDTIIDATNYEEDGEEVEAQAALGIAGPSSMTLRRSTRHSARVTKASSVQEQQATRSVSKRPTVAGRSSNGQRNGRNVETEPLRVITKKLKCTVPGCKKVVKNKKALNRHLLSSHKLKEYRCLVRRCHGKVSTSFTTKEQFTDHLDQVHGRTTRLACHCAKKFNSYRELSTHNWLHHELGHFACSNDGCTFKPTSTRVKVFSHLRIHDEAKYECPVDGCDKSFKRKHVLDQHSLTHTRERPFVCTECDKSFNHKGNLTRHLRIHRNDKCFRCTWPQCTYSSSDRSPIISHIRVIHFELPATKRQQAEEEIEDDRDPRDYLAKD